jgi:hypothetical protein
MEPGFEHTALRGITIKNMIVTIVCTATIVISVMATYQGLRSDMNSQNLNQNNQNKIFELRIKIIEDEVSIINNRIDELKTDKK